MEKDWLKPIVAMAIKLIFSVVLVKLTQDTVGILLPTIFTLGVIYFPWEAWVLYKHLFHRSWRGYIYRMLKYTVITLLGAVLCYAIGLRLAPEISLVSFLVRLCLTGVIFPLIWVGCTFRTPEFKYCLAKVRSMLGKK